MTTTLSLGLTRNTMKLGHLYKDTWNGKEFVFVPIGYDTSWSEDWLLYMVVDMIDGRVAVSRWPKKEFGSAKYVGEAVPHYFRSLALGLGLNLKYDSESPPIKNCFPYATTTDQKVIDRIMVLRNERIKKSRTTG